MALFAFVARRLALLLLVIPAVTLVTFTLSRVVPGDPVALMAGPTANVAVREQLREAWGLDEPLPVQYLIYMGRLAQGDLGMSFRTGRSVAADFGTFFPATIELATFALLLGLPFAIGGGVIAALRHNGRIDYAVRAVVSIGVALPVFWLGILMILIFSASLNVLPSLGRLSLDTPIPPTVTGMYVLDSLLAGQFGTTLDALRHLLLPALCLSLTVVIPVARIVRASMLNALSQEYLRTARSKGLPRATVVFRHAFRNALLPIVTAIGLVYGLLLGGAVVTETVFSWPGIGDYVARSITSLDFQPVLSFTLISAVVFVVINLFVDLLYAALDPRVRLA
jgi:peptide/nickel transport system permease protein